MARKHKHEEHENHERWLVSYADFITLLFAFFVVMYSISSVNEGKYRVLSESMVAAFRSSSRAMAPIQVGELVRSPVSPAYSILKSPLPPDTFTPIVIDARFVTENEGSNELRGERDRWAYDAAEGEVEEISQEVEAAMKPLIERELVSVRRSRFWLEVELNTSFLFDSGDAQPSIDAEVILGQLAKVLKQHENQIHVEGYTDNRPIKSQAFPSNWELSAARAGAVVRLFANNGIAPERLASVGYGEYRPVASNDSEAGRMKNRRVVIVIIANVDENTEESSVTNFELLQRQLENTPSLVN